MAAIFIIFFLPAFLHNIFFTNASRENCKINFVMPAMTRSLVPIQHCFLKK